MLLSSHICEIALIMFGIRYTYRNIDIMPVIFVYMLEAFWSYFDNKVKRYNVLAYEFDINIKFGLG